MMSYNGHLDVGIIACPRIAPDVWTLTGYFREALDEPLDRTGGSVQDRLEHAQQAR
jgi:hypothetical protein